MDSEKEKQKKKKENKLVRIWRIRVLERRGKEMIIGGRRERSKGSGKEDLLQHEADNTMHCEAQDK